MWSPTAVLPRLEPAFNFAVRMGRGEPGRNGRADDGSEIAVLIQKREREEGDGGGQRGRTGAARNKKMTATSTETERVLSELCALTNIRNRTERVASQV